jgi:hypothetical protein
MIVRESINFERGLEPKTSMDVGKSHLDRKILEETDWAIDIDKHGFIYEIIELIRDYKGYPILILKNKQHESWPYRAISVRGAFGDYQPTPEKALEQIKYIISGQLNPQSSGSEDRMRMYEESFVKESVNFERGQDPKRAMDIGKIHNAAWILNDLFFTQQFGESDVEGYRAEISSKDNEDTRVPTYFIKYMEGPMEGQTSRAEKFEELLGQWWGMAKTKRKMHEDINFERGLEPKKAMGIGLTVWEKRIIEETDWHEDLEGVLQVADIIKVIPDYMDSPIVIIKLQPNKFAVGQEPYLGISKFARTELVETPEIAEHDAKIDIENHYIRERDLKNMYLK